MRHLFPALLMSLTACDRQPATSSTATSAGASVPTTAEVLDASTSNVLPAADGSNAMAAVVRTIEKGDGSRIEILSEGGGRPLANGDLAAFEYSASVEGASAPFASTRGWIEPCHVRLGARADTGILPALERALEGLRPGTRARIMLPAALGYGNKGLPQAGIPADSSLVFDLHLLESTR